MAGISNVGLFEFGHHLLVDVGVHIVSNREIGEIQLVDHVH